MPNLCTGTPEITVLDNRGLAVRGLQYNRSVADGPLDERITRSQYSDLGFATSQIDPRLFTLPPSDPPVTPNFQHQSSLSGQSLRTLSVDAGDTAALFDIEGREVWRRDGRGTQIRRTYDTLGRVNAVQEQQAAPAASVCSDRLIYVDTSTDAGGAGQAANQRGQLVRHYDTGGLREIPGYSLQGPMATETRQLLASLDTPADWAGSAELSWQAKLAAEQYTTAWQYDALGTVLAQTDARGNRQSKVLDVAGQVQTASLTQAAQPEKVVLSGVTYSAAGQPLGETAGNGVVTSYTYEPQTQRLTRVTSTKPDKSTVQDLSYTYDPVGNLLNIDDGTQPATFYKNRAVSASRQYTYDALYQLLSATGRENDNAGQQGPTLPGPLTDPEQLVGYTRYYTYDRGGNLMQIQHQGSANYSNPIVVSDRSNHAVAQTAANALKPSDIDTGPYFDACGNSLQQTPGRPLTWNARNQLLTAVTVDRGADPAQNDRESYGYDGSGMRLWKVSQSQTSGTVRQQKVIYLHGLELRTTTSDQTPVETLEVIAAGQIGHASLSVLSWTLGKPSDIPNNQYRYSLGDQVGSVNLELNDQAAIITAEEFYPYGGTAVWGGSASQVKYKFIRYSGKERDATGLYYYGYRYLMPWLGRWLNADPGGTVDGLNLYRMVESNPLTLKDTQGLSPPRRLYRALRPDEIPTRGLRATGRSNETVTAFFHIKNGTKSNKEKKPSMFLSTGSDRKRIGLWSIISGKKQGEEAATGRVAVMSVPAKRTIDPLDDASWNSIVSAHAEFKGRPVADGENKIARNFAKGSTEVLVRGGVKPEEIHQVYATEEITGEEANLLNTIHPSDSNWKLYKDKRAADPAPRYFTMSPTIDPKLEKLRERWNEFEIDEPEAFTALHEIYSDDQLIAANPHRNDYISTPKGYKDMYNAMEIAFKEGRNEAQDLRQRR